MRLAPCLVRKCVEDAEGGWSQSDSKPSRCRRFIFDDRQASAKETFYLCFLSGFGLQAHQQRDSNILFHLDFEFLTGFSDELVLTRSVRLSHENGAGSFPITARSSQQSPAVAP